MSNICKCLIAHAPLVYVKTCSVKSLVNRLYVAQCQ